MVGGRVTDHLHMPLISAEILQINAVPMLGIFGRKIKLGF